MMLQQGSIKKSWLKVLLISPIVAVSLAVSAELSMSHKNQQMRSLLRLLAE